MPPEEISVILNELKHIRQTVDRVELQAIKTNGRVNKLETTGFIVGGILIGMGFMNWRTIVTFFGGL